MTTYGNDKTNKLEIAIITLFGVALFAVLSQPAWRGDEMIAEMRSNCDKVGGVMLENKRMLGTIYECAERKD